MSMSDPIADMLTRIRNAHMIGSLVVEIPHSKLKEAIVKVLFDEGYINHYDCHGDKADKSIKIKLKYYKNKPVITNIRKISKPSLRIYTSSSNIPSIMNGLGIVVISTPKGVMSGKNAALNNVGGELICSVE